MKHMAQTQDEQQVPVDQAVLTYRALEEWKDETVVRLMVVDHLYLSWQRKQRHEINPVPLPWRYVEF